MRKAYEHFTEHHDEKREDDAMRLERVNKHLLAAPLVKSDEIAEFNLAAFKRFLDYALIVNLLNLTGWHVAFTASLLDTSEASLRTRMSRLGLRKGMDELPEACPEASDMIDRYQARKDRSILTRF